jgi:hypothetical protein
MRHERLHTRTETAIHTSSPPNVVTGVVTPESFQDFAVNNNSGAALACAQVQDPAPPQAATCRNHWLTAGDTDGGARFRAYLARLRRFVPDHHVIRSSESLAGTSGDITISCRELRCQQYLIRKP